MKTNDSTTASITASSNSGSFSASKNGPASPFANPFHNLSLSADGAVSLQGQTAPEKDETKVAPLPALKARSVRRPQPIVRKAQPSIFTRKDKKVPTAHSATPEAAFAPALTLITTALENAGRNTAKATETATVVPNTASKLVDSKPVDSKPVDSKPVDSKPVDSKPVDSKSVDSKAAEVKSAEVKTVTAHPVVTKPAATKVDAIYGRMRQAQQSKASVSGAVVHVVDDGKGRIFGVRVKLEGTEVLGFAPFSRLGLGITEVHGLLNSVQSFKVIEVDESKGAIVFNRQAACTEQRLDQLIASLKLGQLLDGKVRNIADCGAFVEIIGAGASGLIHISQLPGQSLDSVKKGQDVKVSVVKLNKVKHQLGLALAK